MPNEPGVDLNQYQKEKDEFAEAMDDVFGADEGKTDEEIMADMEKKNPSTDQDVDGISNKDSDKSADDASKDADDDSDLLTPGQGVATEDNEPATPGKEDPPETDDAEWKTKAELLEAELAKEKQKTSSWNGRITAANKKVKDLETELSTVKTVTAATKPNTDNNESDNEVLDRFRNDFPELSDVVDIMQKRIDGIQAPAKVEADPVSNVDDDNASGDTAPTVIAEHMSAIRKVHPDLSEMVNTGILLTWINKQPDFIRPTLETIYSNGKTDEVINMVTEFKNKTGWKSQLAEMDGNKGKKSDDKLNSMREVNSESSLPDGKTVDKGNYEQGAKDAGL